MHIMALTLKTWRWFPVTLLGILFSDSALAAYLANPGTCLTSAVSITSMEKSPLDGVDPIFPTSTFNPGSVYATSCFGVVEGNDFANPTENIGRFGDGMLNSEPFNKSEASISPTQFISASQLLDLDKNGVPTDPGWILLGKVETGSNTSYTMDGYDKPFNNLIDDILTFSMKCTASTDDDPCEKGTWSLETELDIVDKVQSLLGRSSFDHLAFVLKAGSKDDGGFAIYDFDFNILLQNLLAQTNGAVGFDYETPYSFKGEWSTKDLAWKNLSHVSVWVRDPLENQVPSPATLALVGLGLLALSLTSKKQKTQH